MKEAELATWLDYLSCYRTVERDIGQFKLSARSSPALGVRGEFGGDTLDIVSMGRSTMVLLADVVDKKYYSSRIAARMTKIIHKICASCEENTSPAAVLEELNCGLLSTNSYHEEVAFVTGILMKIRRDEESIHFARAGHPSPIIFGNGASISEIPVEHSFPLNIPGMFAVQEGEIVLRADQRMIMYTDGLTDAGSIAAGFEDRRETLGNVLSRLSSRSTREICDALFSEFVDTNTIGDDTTVVVIGR